MSRVLYDLFLFLYSLTARLLSPFNTKAARWVDGRKQVWNELGKLQPAERRVWFHCASLGEYEQALPLVEKIQSEAEIIITFFSPSGYEVAKKKNPAALIFYLPHDSRQHAKKFMDIVQPRLAVFVRYDLWHYYLNELKSRAVLAILISAVFRKENVFFSWYGNFFHEMLSCFTRIFVQDEGSREVLSNHGFSNVTTAGDTRIDRVVSIQQAAREFPEVQRFKGNKKVFMVGSLEPADEKIVLPVINDAELPEHFKFIVAPHLVSKEYIENLVSRLKKKVCLYSEIKGDAESDVLIIDSIGMLSVLYRYADVAYIGGGFGEGLHNTLEPAAWGVPILFGPEHKKFLEAKELLKQGGAFTVNDEEELKRKTLALLSNPTALGQAQQACLQFIADNKGASQIIFEHLKHSGIV